jgi:Tfp pilus assembly protein PilO
MEAAEILVRYRKLGLKKRTLLLFLLSFSWISYLVIDRGYQLDDRLVQANRDRTTSQQKLRQFQQKEKEVPGLEKRLYRLVEELEKTKKIIPDHFPIDQILQKTAITAQDVDVKMEEFVPGTPVPSTTEYRYASLPIRVHIIGSYGKIVEFIDHIVHWPITVHVTNFQLSLLDIATEDSLPPAAKRKNKRSDSTKISANMDMVLYRSLSSGEVLSIQKQAIESKSLEKKKRTQ